MIISDKQIMHLINIAKNHVQLIRHDYTGSNDYVDTVNALLDRIIDQQSDELKAVE